MDFRSIPLLVSDDEAVYQVLMIVEENLDEESRLPSELKVPTSLLEILKRYSVKSLEHVVVSRQKLHR